MIKTTRLLIGLQVLIAGPVIAGAAETDRLFREQVAPIFEKRCLHCHGAELPKGGLSLATAAGLIQGGKNGPAVVPGKPEESPLLDMVSGDAPVMPQKEKPLSKEQVAGLRRWIEQGAHWPEGLALRDRRFDGQEWWAFRPLSRPPSPAVRERGWVRTPIDAFILGRLEAERLHHSPEADRRTLIRRLTFDLHGLPPTPEEIGRFLGDDDPNAYEELVDRLLASPRYGERWGRHWLDVVHYGDTHGYDKDKRRDHAWPYRDYVIRSLNEDVPYARFIREQIAGDVFGPGDPRGVIATGFIAAGPWDFVGHVELGEPTVEKLKTRLIDRDDMVANTMSTFVSMTVHCARCHDHKFDPIPQREYYRLQAVFAGVDRGDRPYDTREMDRRRHELERERRAACDRLEAIERKIAALVERARRREADAPIDPTLRSDREAARREVAERDVRIKALPPGEMVYAVRPHAPRPIAVLRRGEVEQPGEAVGPGSLSCVPGLDPLFASASADLQDEGSRRAALAEWIASPANPLTWRSIANRIWHYHFGRGLVDTPNDFGRNGSKPTHPELLDWLAVELRDGGRQSLKAIHRMIVCSAVYRQTSHDDPASAKVDADNRWLWRMNRQRLDAEELRDSVLAVSGTLDSTMGGPGFELFRFKDDHSPIYDHTAPEAIDNPRVRRRTVYRFVVRSVPNPFLDCMDSADPNINTPVRSTTITALQALALLNDPFMVQQSREFARRLESLGRDPARQVEAAFVHALGRPPRPAERDALADYARKHGLANACRLLFNTNEFLFID
jgi:mono/diheme cytochrome c family protein